MSYKEKKLRHSCNVCGATRDEKYMQIARETAKMKFWKCIDCDTNRKGALILNGIRYVGLWL